MYYIVARATRQPWQIKPRDTAVKRPVVPISSRFPVLSSSFPPFRRLFPRFYRRVVTMTLLPPRVREGVPPCEELATRRGATTTIASVVDVPTIPRAISYEVYAVELQLPKLLLTLFNHRSSSSRGFYDLVPPTSFHDHPGSARRRRR